MDGVCVMMLTLGHSTGIGHNLIYASLLLIAHGLDWKRVGLLALTTLYSRLITTQLSSNIQHSFSYRTTFDDPCVLCCWMMHIKRRLWYAIYDMLCCWLWLCCWYVGRPPSLRLLHTHQAHLCRCSRSSSKRNARKHTHTSLTHPHRFAAVVIVTDDDGEVNTHGEWIIKLRVWWWWWWRDSRCETTPANHEQIPRIHNCTTYT